MRPRRNEICGFAGRIRTSKLPKEIGYSFYLRAFGHAYISIKLDDYPIDPRVAAGPDIIRKFPASRLPRVLRGDIPKDAMVRMTLFPDDDS